MRGRVAIFIDGNNLFHAARSAGVEIDYAKLLNFLRGESPLLRAFFYTGVDERAERQQGFLLWMRRNGYRVVQKELKTFPDGTKLVTIHDPIRPGKRTSKDDVVPGEIIAEDGEIELNAGRRKATLKVMNTGDRPVQIGSHYHFFETNKALDFDREKSFGMHLDIPAGTSVRFAPGESKEVVLTEFGGTGELLGLNGLTEGNWRSEANKAEAMQRARARGFKGA